eukprot:8184364-Lingulodinium_polyedra.AAC.1
MCIRDSYRPGMGVVAELIFKGAKGGMGLYARMEFPPQDIQDLEFKCIEERLRGPASAQAILDALPDVTRMAVPDIWQKVDESIFVFRLGKWELVPPLDWD